MHSSVSPIHCCPVMMRHDKQLADTEIDEEVADPKLAMMKDPIVGIENVTRDDANGAGALPAKPLPSRKEMTAAQRAVHDLTHLPYHPGCAICVSCRRPNDHPRMLKNSKRTIPLVLGDDASPRNFCDEDSQTLLVMHVYPYKIWMVCRVPSKGGDPRVVARISRFVKDLILLIEPTESPLSLR